MNHIPDVAEEIQRKSIESIQDLLSLRQQSRIGDPELMVGLRAIWNCVSGLCESQTMDLLSNLMNSVKDSRINDIQVWIGNGKMMVLTWEKWAMSVEIRSVSGTSSKTLFDPAKHADPAWALAKHLEALQSGLTKSGMKRIV